MNSSSDPITPTKSRAARPVRLGLVSCNLYPLLVGQREGFGGAELDVFTLGKAMAAREDMVVDVLTQTRDASPISEAFGMRVCAVQPRVHVSQRAPGLRGKYQDLVYVARFFIAAWGLARRSQVVFTEVASLQAALTLLACRLARCPVVFRFGSDLEADPQTLPSFCFAGSQRLARYFLRLLADAQDVIAQTENQAELVRKNLGLQCRVVRNAHEIPGPPASSRDRRGMLWVGRADPVKGPDLLVDLAERVPDVPFTFVMAPSYGHEASFDAAEARCAKLANVTLIPGLPNDEVQERFRHARALVMTSRAEGLPNVLIEALKHGTPVLTLNTNPDGILAVGNATSAGDTPGWCAEGDLDVLAQWVMQVATDDQLWQATSRCAYDTAGRLFRLETIMEDYAKTFRGLAG